MSIVVTMAHDARYTEMAAVTQPLVARYCERHGYYFHYEPSLDEREGDACKIRIFNQLYASGQFSGDDVYAWFDTDLLVMDSSVPLEFYCGAGGFDEAHVLYGSDPNGINTGVWFARFTSRADHFLRAAMQASLSMGWADQVGIFQTMLQPIFAPWVRVIAGKGFNSIPYELYGWNWPHGNEINAYEKGDLILHLPGIEMSERVRLLREYAKVAV